MSDIVERLRSAVEKQRDERGNMFDLGIADPWLDEAAAEIERLRHAASIVLPVARWPLGQTVRKKKGSQWHGTIVGFYSTSLTPIGYAVESATEKGSVQIYPEAALEDWTP